MSQLSVLQNFKPEHLKMEPFPYIHIPEVLPWDLYERLEREYPEEHCTQRQTMGFGTIRYKQHEFDYENVVSNSEDQISKILNFCDLDWDENCLNHHKNKKTMIKTVSTFRSRKPIYKTSIDSSKFYSKNLEKYFKQLEYK